MSTKFNKRQLPDSTVYNDEETTFQAKVLLPIATPTDDKEAITFKFYKDEREEIDTALNAKANISGQVFTGVVSATNLSGTNTGDNAPNSLYSGLVTNATHTGEVTGSTALTITNGAVTNAKLANVATSTLKGRVAAATGVVEDLTASQVRTLLNVADGANNYVHPANHLASIITQDASNRFVTDTEKSAWNAKEPAIASGTISQYWRGDKTWQTFPDQATVDQTIIDGSTNAVSGNAVFDALATKATLATIAQIRALSGTLPNNYFYTTNIGQEGNWYFDNTDTTTSDNTGTVLVTADGKRIKRIFNTLSVKYFGAKGDETTDDTTSVFNALGVSKTLGIPLFFPKGTYYISHIGASDAFSSSTIYSDKGTILSVLDAPNVSTTVDALNPIKVKLRFLNAEVWLTPKNKDNVNEKSQSISTKDAKFQKNKLLDFTTLSYKTISWPEGDLYSNHTPSSVSASQVQLTGTLGAYVLGLAPAEVGKSSTIQFKSATGGDILVYIRTTTGSHGVSVGIGDVSTPAEFHKSLGISGTSSLFSYPGLGTHGSYSFFRSNITIRTMNKNTYSVMLNGVVVQNNVKVSGEILEVGFGVANVGTVVITDWVDSFSDIDEGKSIVKLAIFGDSRTDDSEYMNWPDYTKKYLDGVAGIRVHDIYNYAVSGQSISQQKVLCTPENIANANVVVIDIGTNDIQIMTNEDTFATDLETMIDVCLTAKKRVIIGVPDLFYTKGQAGSRGQGSVNYDRHKGIRAKCMSIAAKKGVYFIDKGQILGPILAQYVNPSIHESYVSLGLDPILYDNIHPTTYGRMILGREYAKSIMAVLMEKIDYATVDKLDLKAPLASPSLTGTPTAPTSPAGTNTTQIATTAFVQAAKSSGSYTPTLNSSANISSITGAKGMYTKVGNVVTCSIYCIATVTTIGATSLKLTKPIVTTVLDAIGSGTISKTGTGVYSSVYCAMDSSSIIIGMNPTVTGDYAVYVTIQYLVN